ncbi:MAG: hypothetical protein ACOCVY_02580 [Patescibacteria group bacterium]
MKAFKKNVKKKKRSSYPLFFLLTIFAILIVVNFFLIEGKIEIATGESTGCKNVDFDESQTIYKRTDCSGQNCECRGSGEKLFTFVATDANCSEKDTQMERLECFLKNSYPEYKCEEKSLQEEVTPQSVKEECLNQYSQYQVTPHKYYLGEAGTFINNSDLIINGYRTYIKGFKGEKHGFYTGFEKNVNKPVEFIKDSRNVKFGGDFSIGKSIDIGSPKGGIFLDADVSFGEIDYQLGENKGKRIKGITEADRGTGLEVYRDNVGYLKSDHKNFFTFNSGNSSVSVKKGAQIKGDIKSSRMYLQRKQLHWSKPIRGNFILYYK